MSSKIADTEHGDNREVFYRKSENTPGWLILSMFSVRR